jgi:type VI secretion system secreted protein Hcp
VTGAGVYLPAARVRGRFDHIGTTTESGSMALDMFIKIGDLKGESKDAEHKEKIDVLAWSWGVSNAGTFHAGGGGGAGKANVQDFSFTKWLDASSPPLLQACCTGKHFDKATLHVRKAGDKPLEYLKIEFTKVLVTAVSTGGSGGEDRLTENVTLNFAKVEVNYTEQSAEGSAGTSKPKMSFSPETNSV